VEMINYDCSNVMSKNDDEATYWGQTSPRMARIFT
jgi:hypothetical protein